MPKGSIHIKRAYDKAETGDGLRFLVDRLWPRGIKKTELKLDGWLKDAAPSNELRKEFHHSPERWPDFRKCYLAELDANPDVWHPLLEAARSGPVTLLYGAKDQEHNNAVVLADYLNRKLTSARSR